MRSLSKPRLLPCAMLAMTALLAWKTAGLVRAAAAEIPPGAVPAPASASQPVREVAAPASLKLPEVPPVSAAERTVLLDLRQRRVALDAREAALAPRESVLAAAEKRLTARTDELTALQHRLEALEAGRQGRDEAGLRSMVKVYETMRAKDAASIFNDLDPAILLPISDRMTEVKLAAVLATMLPDRARRLTADLALLRARANEVSAHP